jgi:inorganic pyrophosphatase/exopolyphosphatase
MEKIFENIISDTGLVRNTKNTKKKKTYYKKAKNLNVKVDKGLQQIIL